MTVVNDLERGRVFTWPKTANRRVWTAFWGTLTEAQREGIQAVAMDMWDPYVDSVREHVADADKKIVFDKFHVAQHLAKPWTRCAAKRTKLCAPKATIG